MSARALYRARQLTVVPRQSALTGESLPVVRNTGATVYSGSIMHQGKIDALVYGTAQNTYFGKTTQLVAKAHTVSHFQRAVLKIGDYLIALAVALVALILAVALFRGDPMTTTLLSLGFYFAGTLKSVSGRCARISCGAM